MATVHSEYLQKQQQQGEERSAQQQQPPTMTPTTTTNTATNTKKQEFRTYLEQTGVLDALTKVLVGLYEEPDRQNINAMEYMQQYLGAPSAVDWQGLQQENEQLRHTVERLEQQLAAIREN